MPIAQPAIFSFHSHVWREFSFHGTKARKVQITSTAHPRPATPTVPPIPDPRRRRRRARQDKVVTFKDTARPIQPFPKRHPSEKRTGNLCRLRPLPPSGLPRCPRQAFSRQIAPTDIETGAAFCDSIFDALAFEEEPEERFILLLISILTTSSSQWYLILTISSSDEDNSNDLIDTYFTLFLSSSKSRLARDFAISLKSEKSDEVCSLTIKFLLWDAGRIV
ncbi:hypothetical protein PoB_000778400 [Plakobranchus ocellatus]|uniref:Uncharacterized protein n=1 Tax=Plakobranchus ocellatus TaxID=259542 RepID=A0AAV3YGX8_9GAST|nr:hypothetical protein PoB_000778400 [Plakobranchus ocellatus]